MRSKTILIFVSCIFFSSLATASIGDKARWKSKIIPQSQIPEAVLRSLNPNDASKTFEVELFTDETFAGRFDVYEFISKDFCNQTEGCLHVLYVTRQDSDRNQDRLVQFWCRNCLRHIPSLIRGLGDNAGASIELKTDCCILTIAVLKNGNIIENLESAQGRKYGTLPYQ